MTLAQQSPLPAWPHSGFQVHDGVWAARLEGYRHLLTRDLFDALYLAVRKGRRFSSLPEVSLPEGFAVAEMESWIRKIGHLPIRVGVKNRWRELKVKSLVDEVT